MVYELVLHPSRSLLPFSRVVLDAGADALMLDPQRLGNAGREVLLEGRTLVVADSDCGERSLAGCLKDTEQKARVATAAEWADDIPVEGRQRLRQGRGDFLGSRSKVQMRLDLRPRPAVRPCVAPAQAPSPQG